MQHPTPGARPRLRCRYGRGAASRISCKAPGRRAASPRPRHPPVAAAAAAGSRMRLPASNATASTFGSGSGASSGHVTMVLNPASDNPAPVSAAPVRSSATTTTAIGSAPSSRIGTIYILAVRSAPITGERRRVVSTPWDPTSSRPPTSRCSTSPPVCPDRRARCRSRRRCCASARPATCSAGRRTPAWAGTPSALGGREFLILSTHGGIRAPDGTPIALGYHTGHWEVGLLMEAAAREFKAAGAIPFAASCTDPCDGRSQGTPAMFDSLAYRNDAAMVFRRLIRSLPTRRGVLGVATCDKGLPAMMMALAASHDLPCVLVPGGVTLLPDRGRGRGARPDDRRALRARRDLAARRPPISAAAPARRRAAAASSSAPPRRRRWSAKRSGMSLGHSALAPSGHPIWLDMARRSARALMALEQRGVTMRDILTDAALQQRDGHARRVRRLDQPDPAPAGDRARRGPAPADRAPTGPTSTGACRASSMRCRTGRGIIRPSRSFWPAACRR